MRGERDYGRWDLMLTLFLSADARLYFARAAMLTDRTNQNLFPFLRYDLSDL